MNINYNFVASLIFGSSGLYFSFMNLFTNLYSRACYKIEESCKYIIGDYKYIPTEEQFKIVEKQLQAMEEDKNQSPSVNTRHYYYKINVTRYRLIVGALKIMTFGLFKHVV